MKDKFNQNINVGDIIIFATSGEMDEGIVTKVGKINKISIKNSSGYIKIKVAKHVINKTELELNHSTLLI